jgi:hypothetical protein
MTDYIRPGLPKQVYYEADGAAIEYGYRWRGGSPPEETYSVASNPERFAPLQTVADALIDHLRQRYAVSVSDDIAAAADLMHERDDVLRAVRMVPNNPDAAALTFVFTAYPAVVVHAGLPHDFPFPQYGCDACDESLEVLVEDLERLSSPSWLAATPRVLVAVFGPTSAIASRARMTRIAKGVRLSPPVIQKTAWR